LADAHMPPAHAPHRADAKHTGLTEQYIGSWVLKHPDNRAKLVIATKVRMRGWARATLRHGGSTAAILCPRCVR
jgi:aryl-alcohol dehydrogenase-like predicted oxidoreductase